MKIGGDNLFRPHIQACMSELQRFLGKSIPNMPLIFYHDLHLIHDGAPAHFSVVACRYLNKSFRVDE
jgi:hypothetical protein